jgi:hypothetical protein
LVLEEKIHVFPPFWLGQASGMEKEPAWHARKPKPACKAAVGGYLTGFKYFRVHNTWF